ncbi:MAG: hypothetical protein DRQ04_02680 [Candidatus Hydrothermota bacterium]|nr:MAG: hypothetical protein DRQ04_02680 [Candidatus Hydrothermae bacterium]
MDFELTEESTIEELVTRFPQTVNVFIKHGIPCIVCGEPLWGTIKENAEKYGVKDLQSLMDELRSAIESGTGFFLGLDQTSK